MVQRIIVTADAAAALHLEEAAVAAMAFDLTDAAVDLDVIEECSSELLRRKHPTGAVARLVEQSIEVARLQKTDRTIEQWSPDEQ